jgi:hypothetical protein
MLHPYRLAWNLEKWVWNTGYAALPENTVPHSTPKSLGYIMLYHHHVPYAPDHI